MAYSDFSKGTPSEYSDPLVPWNQQVAPSSCDGGYSMPHYHSNPYHVPPPSQFPSQLSSNQYLLCYPQNTQLSFATYNPPNRQSESPYPDSASSQYDSSNSSNITTCSGDIPSSAVASPEASLLLTPEQHYRDLSVTVQSPYTYNLVYGSYEEPSCVTMMNVQGFPDEQFDEGQADFSSYQQEPQELVPAINSESGSIDSMGDDHIPNPQLNDTIDQDDDEIKVNHWQPDTIHVRQTKQPQQQRATAPSVSTRRRIEKRPSKRRRPTSRPSKSSSATSANTLPSGPYPCPLAPYGCPQTFGAKNEWKRHAYTKHFCLSHWRCDQCPDANKRPNDFNRKDLFVQHVRRMHPPSSTSEVSTSPVVKAKMKKAAKSRARSVRKTNLTHAASDLEAMLNSTAERCHVSDREAPLCCACVFCEATFEGPGCLEERMEHVGRHMEETRKEGLAAVSAQLWRGDAELEMWLMRHKLVVKRKGGLVLS